MTDQENVRHDSMHIEHIEDNVEHIEDNVSNDLHEQDSVHVQDSIHLDHVSMNEDNHVLENDHMFSHDSVPNMSEDNIVHEHVDENTIEPMQDAIHEHHTENLHESLQVPAPVRRSNRIIQKPSYLQHYHCNNAISCAYPIEDHISPSLLSSEYIAFISNIASSHEPSFYHQAVKFPEWRTAMDEELKAMESLHTWSVVPLPEGKTPIECK
ncbi:hypothetical protein HRI_001383500 [Hibiscus trionum]|uniref:Uncharacterized protein n=1 Tax=Hibiscus trionum TaxID=183268 RepID=A0A9W7HHS2_HIBTR|nr:hypothetical protein HRI_001383500 [Hibiscus trionum]